MTWRDQLFASPSFPACSGALQRAALRVPASNCAQAAPARSRRSICSAAVMDAAALGQNEQLAPAVLVFMLLISVLRAAAARIQAPSPMRTSASHPAPHAHHAGRHAAPRPELPPPATPPRSRAVPRDSTAHGSHAAAARPRSLEPRRRRGAVPLLLRPLAWVARFVLSPVGALCAVRALERLRPGRSALMSAVHFIPRAGRRRSGLPAPTA